MNELKEHSQNSDMNANEIEACIATSNDAPASICTMTDSGNGAPSNICTMTDSDNGAPSNICTMTDRDSIADHRKDTHDLIIPANPQISRRGFIASAIGTAATCVASAALIAEHARGTVHAPEAAYASEPDNADASSSGNLSRNAGFSADPLSVPSSAVFTTSDCEYLEDIGDRLHLVASIHLPYDTLLWAGDDEVAVCLLPCDTSTPLTMLGLISLTSGEMNTVLNEAIGEADGFQIFDARANKHGAVWLESNVSNNEWRIYTAPVLLDGGSPRLGEAILGAEGNGEWLPPELGVSGEYAIWQISPDPQGSHAKEASTIMRLGFGLDADDAKMICESRGQFACAPSTTVEIDETGAITNQYIVCAPRTGSSSSQYQLTLIDTDSGQLVDVLLLPSSMRPSFISYGKTGFSFSFDGIYSFGDGISGLGTYTCASNVDSASNGTAGEWYRCDRTPYTQPAWCGTWFIVKSSSAIALVDLVAKQYTTITPEHVTQGYGEFLVSCGTVKRFATYSNIDYTPLGGSQIRECNVRIWSA